MQRIWRIKREESYSPLSCHDRTHRSCHREESVVANQYDVEDRRGAEQVINYQPEFAEASPEDPSPRQHIGHVQGNAEGTCNRRGPLALRCGSLYGGCPPGEPQAPGRVLPPPRKSPAPVCGRRSALPARPGGGSSRGMSAGDPGAAEGCRGGQEGGTAGGDPGGAGGGTPEQPGRRQPGRPCPPRRGRAARPAAKLRPGRAGQRLGGRGAPRGAALYLLGNPKWPG